MDRAAKAVRRGGLKLLSDLGGGHGNLNVLISEHRDWKNSAKALMMSQNAATQYLMKWAMTEENTVIQDVCGMLAELNAVWTQVQGELTEHLREYKQMFESILEGEKQLDQCRANLTACEQREVKLKKELKKAARRATLEDLNYLENKIIQAERNKEALTAEVQQRVGENEVAKQLRFREGLLKISEAYTEFGHKCSILHEAQASVCLNIPQQYQTNSTGSQFTGFQAAKQVVLQAIQKVERYRREDYMYRPDNTPDLSEAPPPYDPGDFFHDSLTDGAASAWESPTRGVSAQSAGSPNVTCNPSGTSVADTLPSRPTPPRFQRTRSLPSRSRHSQTLPRQHSWSSRQPPALPARPWTSRASLSPRQESSTLSSVLRQSQSAPRLPQQPPNALTMATENMATTQTTTKPVTMETLSSPSPSAPPMEPTVEHQAGPSPVSNMAHPEPGPSVEFSKSGHGLLEHQTSFKIIDVKSEGGETAGTLTEQSSFRQNEDYHGSSGFYVAEPVVEGKDISGSVGSGLSGGTGHSSEGGGAVGGRETSV